MTLATPVFTIEGRPITSDGDAIKAIADHVAGIYAVPIEEPIMPPWNERANMGVLALEDAVRGGPRSL